MNNYTMDKMEHYLIWWLTYAQVDMACKSKRKYTLPRYIRRQLNSIQGRPLRGRLWVPDGLNCENLTDDVCQRMDTEFLCIGITPLSDCGGIVFLKDDYRHLLGMPGRISDTDLKPVFASGEPLEVGDAN